MNEITVSEDKRREEYEGLLLIRDILRKEAGSFLTSYIAEFGKLITAVFEKKVQCIKLKKSIAFCQAALNRGETPDAKSLADFIEKNMAEYYKQLNDMIADSESARNAKTFSEATVRKCARLYRKIAKMVHPDLNPKAAESAVLQELWNRAITAHNHNDLKELEELFVLVQKAVKDEKLSMGDVEIPDIEERIKNLQLEIEEITGTEPYTYGRLLKDPVKTGKKKTELQLELEEYENYVAELEKILSGFTMKGGTPWQMN